MCAVIHSVFSLRSDFVFISAFALSSSCRDFLYSDVLSLFFGCVCSTDMELITSVSFLCSCFTTGLTSMLISCFGHMSASNVKSTGESATLSMPSNLAMSL